MGKLSWVFFMLAVLAGLCEVGRVDETEDRAVEAARKLDGLKKVDSAKRLYH